MGLNSGPVHLNFPFREPLFLQNSDTDPVIAEFPEPKLYQDPLFASDELIALSSLTKKSKRPIFDCRGDRSIRTIVMFKPKISNSHPL